MVTTHGVIALRLHDKIRFVSNYSSYKLFIQIFFLVFLILFYKCQNSKTGIHHWFHKILIGKLFEFQIINNHNSTIRSNLFYQISNRVFFRIDLTLDRAVRVINYKNNIVLALSSTGSSSALLHPNGRVFQYGSRVEILAHDAHGNNK